MRTIIVVWQIACAQRELRNGGGGNTCAGRWVADETTIAATGRAGVGSRVGGKVAAGTALYDSNN